MSANAQSRRSLLLAGLSAPVAVAIPAAIAAPTGDAELLALGREFEPATLARNALQPSFDELDAQCEAEVEAWCEAHPEPGSWSSYAVLKAWEKQKWAATFAIWKRLGRDDHPLFAADERQSAIANQIEDLTASTLAGLAVKARVAGEYVLSAKEREAENPKELDYDKFLLRTLIENIRALAERERRA